LSIFINGIIGVPRKPRLTTQRRTASRSVDTADRYGFSWLIRQGFLVVGTDLAVKCKKGFEDPRPGMQSSRTPAASFPKVAKSLAANRSSHRLAPPPYFSSAHNRPARERSGHHRLTRMPTTGVPQAWLSSATKPKSFLHARMNKKERRPKSGQFAARKSGS